MTAYQHAERHYWRYRLRVFARRITLMLACAALLLAAPGAAEAQTTVRCRKGTQPGFYHPAPRGVTRTVGQCFVYRGPRGAGEVAP